MRRQSKKVRDVRAAKGRLGMQSSDSWPLEEAFRQYELEYLKQRDEILAQSPQYADKIRAYCEIVNKCPNFFAKKPVLPKSAIKHIFKGKCEICKPRADKV